MLRRAWELGATNDMWWLDTTNCYNAWNRAIEEAGLSWKYRQVLGGEWNSLEMLGDARFRKQGAFASGICCTGTGTKQNMTGLPLNFAEASS